MRRRHPAKVLCPCCDHLLYETVPLGTSEIVVQRGLGTNPEMLWDKDGPYMQCPHCLEHIDFKHILVQKDTATSFELAPEQDCH